MKALLTYVISSSAVLFLFDHFSFAVTLKEPLSAVYAAVVIGLLNVSIRPFLQLISLPITLITFGLFAIVINVSILFLASYLVSGFDLAGFIPALILLISLSFTQTVVKSFLD